VLGAVAAALLVGVGVGAAAFGGGSGGSSPVAASGAAQGSLAASASTAASAHSVAFTLSATATSPGTVSTLVTGSGTFDLSSGIGQMTATVPAVTSLTGGGAVTLISDGSNLYLQVPALSALTGGKSWVEVPLSSVASLGGQSSGSSSVSALANPAGVLGLLGRLGGPVTRVGTVSLGGVTTTEYRTTISVASIASRLDHGALTPSESGAASALTKLGIPSIPVTAWVGQDGLLRQVSVSVDLTHATLGGLLGSGNTVAGKVVTVTVGLSHYGQPVSITVPPASDTTDLGSIADSVHGLVSHISGDLSGIAQRI